MPSHDVLRAVASRQLRRAGSRCIHQLLFQPSSVSRVTLHTTHRPRGVFSSSRRPVPTPLSSPAFSLPSIASSRSFSTGKKETLEEMAKRLSDEADAEFKASGRQSNISSRMKLHQPSTQPDATNEASAANQQSTQPSSDSSSSSTSTAEPSGPSSSPSSSSSSSSSSRPRRSVLTAVSEEWGHFRDYLKKWQRPSAAIARNKRSAAEVLTKPTIIPKKPTTPLTPPPEDDTPTPSPTADPSTPPPPSDLILVDSDTVWDKRLERMRDSFQSSAPFLKFRKARRTLISSQNPILRPIQSVVGAVGETLEDMKLTWETSQHPMLFKVRDVTDRVIGETEMGFALGEVMKVDPSFDLLSFQREMEEYQIPVVITAYLRGSPSDQRLLAQCCEGMAATHMRASFHERMAQGEEWDSRILDISHVELQRAVMLKDMPVLMVVFMVQQVNCVRKVKGFTPKPKEGEKVVEGKEEEKVKRLDSEGREIVKGSESDIESMYYHWVIRRDFENPDFDWKIVEMVSQKVFSIV